MDLANVCEKSCGQYLGLICDESLTCRGLNLNSWHFGSFTFIPCFMWRIVFACLVVCRWQEEDTWCRGPGMVAHVRYLVAGWSGGQVTLCTICTVHIETRSAGFLVEPQSHGVRFVSGLASKPPARFVSGLTSKPLRWVCPVWPQNRWLGFLNLCLKTGNYGLVICDLKSLWWFPSIYRLCHKTDGARMACDTCWDLVTCFTWKQVALEFLSLALILLEARLQVMHVVLSRRLRREKAKDEWVDTTGCVGPFYPKIIVFIVLGPNGIIVFCLDL
jgi:hypothetical protein